MLHEIATFTAATGLSLGLLIGCAALFYFVSTMRATAIYVAVAVIAVYGAFLYGEHDARAAVTKEWNAANARAAAAAKARDAAAAKSIAGQYDPVIGARDKRIADLNSQVQAYEKKIAAAKGGRCPLGAAALSLRRTKRR